MKSLLFMIFLIFIKTEEEEIPNIDLLDENTT